MTEVPGEREVVSGGEGDVPRPMSMLWTGEVRVIEPQDRDAGVPAVTK